jgi:hypothetical protein
MVKSIPYAGAQSGAAQRAKTLARRRNRNVVLGQQTTNSR